jgi:DNA-binding MarR family transcriptional regulator
MAANTESRPLVLRIAEARRQVQALSAEIREKTGVTATQAQVLCTLLEYKGVSQTFLVGKTGIDRSTLTDVVVRMVRDGLLTRRRSKKDERTNVVNLTTKGEELAQKVCKTT